jgi:DNA modification methylase
MNQSAQACLGYPTQKPEALLERIIIASSNEGVSFSTPSVGADRHSCCSKAPSLLDWH